MSKRIAFTPRQAVHSPGKPVARRILFYLPGYDPEAERRYRTLFMREVRRYAKGFRIKLPSISRAVMGRDGRHQSWTVEVEDRGIRTRTEYQVLLWSDLVQGDMAQPGRVGLLTNARAILKAATDGTLARLFRASWPCTGVIVYPFVLSILLLFAVLASGFVGYGLLGRGLGLPAWIALAAGWAIGLGGLALLAPHLHGAFYWQLMYDWVFHWQHASRRRPDYLARLDAFADHIQAAIAASEADEILFVGHSTGGLTAVELVSRLLARDVRFGREGPVVSLLTLGSSLPVVALQPDATATRDEIASLMTSHRVVWVDYQAPQDWMNFPAFNPVRDLPLAVPEAEAVNPIIRSALFSEIIEAETYRQIRLRPFRMHFQFLMANDRAGVFDIFAFTLGSRCLRDRVLGEDSAPLGSG